VKEFILSCLEFSKDLQLTQTDLDETVRQIYHIFPHFHVQFQYHELTKKRFLSFYDNNFEFSDLSVSEKNGEPPIFDQNNEKILILSFEVGWNGKKITLCHYPFNYIHYRQLLKFIRLETEIADIYPEIPLYELKDEQLYVRPVNVSLIFPMFPVQKYVVHSFFG
jgi:hypothetical protein